MYSLYYFIGSFCNSNILKNNAMCVPLSRCFFDACDGIFLNYTWKEEGLDESLAAAGARCHDVYVGVDVFGRNCYGGGGFNSHKVKARLCSMLASELAGRGVL